MSGAHAHVFRLRTPEQWVVVATATPADCLDRHAAPAVAAAATLAQCPAIGKAHVSPACSRLVTLWHKHACMRMWQQGGD